MSKLVKILTNKDIFQEYRQTPIGLLLEYHNLNRQFDKYENAQILIGMCMDNRKHLHIPENFAFIIRSGGADLRNSEFRVSYAIAVGQVKHIALIGHNNCGMVDLFVRKEKFIQGLIKRIPRSLLRGKTGKFENQRFSLRFEKAYLSSYERSYTQKA